MIITDEMLNKLVNKLENEEERDEFEHLLETRAKKKQFMITDKMGFLTVECPSCNEKFGVSASFENEVSESLFKYICPYCGYTASIKK